uniref:Uncharacterized protein n=1 Tax=viral metagenome TaxID=1070528 RepID=A0A6M3LNS6_9ZZZZ
MKPRKVTLKQIGYTIKGISTLCLWDGSEGIIQMNKEFIPIDNLSHTNLLKCINDGGFGCEEIKEATLDIYDLFENEYKEFNRIIKVKGMPHRQKLFNRGI